jgi:Rieske Fe-S protein
VTIPVDVREAVAFVDDVIVCRGDGAVRVFAARCTHLGCRIARVSDGLLVCPCHGSKFRTDGSVASGPASRPLDVLPYRTDPRTGVLTVHAS